MRNNYHGHLSNIHSFGIEVGDDMSSRHKPRIETTMYVNRDELTLAHLSHLIEKTDNYPENTKVTIRKDRVTVVQESTKPVTLAEHRGNGHIHFSAQDQADTQDFLKEMERRARRVGRSAKPKKDLPPRDHLGRFTKRK